MFWYQCRYCKVNFDQWEKLVTHRRDEHKQEFEALKRRSALLLKRLEETDTINRTPRVQTRKKTCEIFGKTLSTSNIPATTLKMKPTSPCTSSSLSPVTSPPRPNQHSSSSKELDAKDLENHEISLCIPSSSSVNLRSSSIVTPTPFNRSSTPPCSLPSPSPSPPLANGSVTPRCCCINSCNITNDSHPIHSVSTIFTTPPETPLRFSLTSSSSSPLSSADEFNVNWSPPADLNKLVQYHQISDDDEIQISVIPSAGSCVSVTKHSSFRGSLPTAIATRTAPPPYVANGGSSSFGQPDISLNGEDHSPNVSQQQNMNNSHVVIESLENELRMTCSNGSINVNGMKGKSGDNSTPATLRHGLRRRSHLEMLKSTGQRLKRIHSLLQRRQHQLGLSRKFPTSRLKSSSSSSPSASSALNGAKGVATTITRSYSNGRSGNTATPTRPPSQPASIVQMARSSRSFSNGGMYARTTPSFSRSTTRASPRRPK